MLRRWLLGGLSLGLMASALLAKPGVVTNRQGETFTGDVTEDDKFVYVNGTGGQLRLDKRNIDKIQYAASIDDQYNARHAKLAANDVKGRIALANWANDNQRVDLAIAALKEARDIDPTNREAALAMDADQRQLDLDQATANKNKKTSTATPASPTAEIPAPPAPVTPPSAPTPSLAKALEHRLLNADEINVIRQKEMQPDDAKLRVRFENGVIKKYLATGDHDAKAFLALSAPGQANEILTNGDPKMAKDVQIVTDPVLLVEFKQKILPIVAQGCGSIACHGGSKGGDFALFPGQSTPAVYTNFYILQTYTKTIDKVKYLAMDRDVPDHSLVLQFGLPVSMGIPPHPSSPNFKPKFHTTDDVTYQTLYTFLSKTLRLPQPDYGIKVAPNLPATEPVAGN
jgi:hypothetical protein